MKFLLDRRTLLRGAGGLAIGLPFLEAMLPRRASAQTAAPRRFIAISSCNGTIPTSWRPSNFVLTANADRPMLAADLLSSRILSPLSPLADKVVCIEGPDDLAAYNFGGAHDQGMGCMLTCVGLPNNSPQGGLANGPSVDQVISKTVGTGTRFPSMQAGVNVAFVRGRDVTNYITYAGPAQPLVPDNDPSSIFKNIFAGAGGGSTTYDKLVADRKSVLDGLQRSYAALEAKLGSADKARLEAHLDSIRTMETRLLAPPPPSSGVCTPVAPGAIPKGFMDNDAFPTVSQQQIDLIVNAFACDLTRVATLQYSRGLSPVVFNWLSGKWGGAATATPITRGHHDLSHNLEALATQDMLTAINNWFAGQLFSLANKLNNTLDIDGSNMLDNTVILWCLDLQQGSHSRYHNFYVVVGGKNLNLRGGRYLTYGNPDNLNGGAGGAASNTNLMISMLNYMGNPTTTFGDPAFGNGPLKNPTL